MRVGHLVLAIDPDALAGRKVFLDRVEHICRRIESASPNPGVAKVMLPGQPEEEKRAQSERLGIPLSEKIRADLAALAQELGVAMPEPVGGEAIH
jgi:L-lactate dehydrogenase